MLKLFGLQKEEEIAVNPAEGFEGIVCLIEAYKIPVTRATLLKVGSAEGLSEKMAESILDKNNKTTVSLNTDSICKWHLEKIVFAFIIEHRIMTGSHYKLFVNLVNNLKLNISFFDRTIIASKKNLHK